MGFIKCSMLLQAGKEIAYAVDFKNAPHIKTWLTVNMIYNKLQPAPIIPRVALWFSSEIVQHWKMLVSTYKRDHKDVVPPSPYLAPAPVQKDMIADLGKFVKAVLDKNYLHGGFQKKQEFLTQMDLLMKHLADKDANKTLRKAQPDGKKAVGGELLGRILRA